MVDRYSRPSFIILLAGILPFGSIFIEMFYILTSLWTYMFYHVYGLMLLVFVILIVVLLCTSIVAVYFVLNTEVSPVHPCVYGQSLLASRGQGDVGRISRCVQSPIWTRLMLNPS